MSESNALAKAREIIPEPYHDRIWLLHSPLLEQQLGMTATSYEATIVVLYRQGKIAAPRSQKCLNRVVMALKSLRE